MRLSVSAARCASPPASLVPSSSPPGQTARPKIREADHDTTFGRPASPCGRGTPARFRPGGLRFYGYHAGHHVAHPTVSYLPGEDGLLRADGNGDLRRVRSWGDRCLSAGRKLVRSV